MQHFQLALWECTTKFEDSVLQNALVAIIADSHLLKLALFDDKKGNTNTNHFDQYGAIVFQNSKDSS
jgi:hypothetical protein